MADNVDITPGTGATVAADEVVDGTLGTVKVQYVKIMDGALDGTTKAGVGANGIKVDGSGATQPISAASLPLPSGAATAAKQPALGTAGTASADVITVQGKSGMVALVTDGSGVTQPVSVASLPLPSGAATSASQSTGNTSLSSIDGKLVTSKTDDYDTGAGTDTVQTIGIALPASGGHVVGGTSTNPLRTDPTGATTQPVSAASLPLPAGAATAAKQPALGTAGTASADVITVQGKSGMTAVVVDGSAVTQPVSAATLPLPSGAATAAKQPALGTAGTASADVLTIQGKAGMTAVVVDGSGVTQPISAASLPLPAGAALDATLTGGTLVAIAKGAAAAGAAVSGNPVYIGGSDGANIQPVALRNTSPATTDYGQVVRSAGDISTSGTTTAQGATAGATTTTNTTANSFVGPLSLNGHHTCIWSIANPAATPTHELQGTVDGTNWFRIQSQVFPSGAVQNNQTAAVATTVFVSPVAGCQQIRVMATGASPGTTTVNMRATYGAYGTSIFGMGGATVLGAVTQSGTWTTQPGNTQNTTPWLQGLLRKRIQATSSGLTIATTAYTTGDQMGGEMTLTSMARASGGSGIIRSVIVTSDDTVTVGAFDILLFPAAASPATDNSASAFSDANIQALIGTIPVPALTASTNNAFAMVNNLNIPFNTTTTANLFANMVARSAQVIFTTATALRLTFLVEQD
jgi:hypothetical protein